MPLPARCACPADLRAAQRVTGDAESTGTGAEDIEREVIESSCPAQTFEGPGV